MFARVSLSSVVQQLCSAAAAAAAPACQEQRAVGDVCCRAEPHSRSSQASPTPRMTRKYRPSLYSDILKHQSFCLHLETVILRGKGGGDVGLQFNLDKKSFARLILGAALIEEV